MATVVPIKLKSILKKSNPRPYFRPKKLTFNRKFWKFVQMFLSEFSDYTLTREVHGMEATGWEMNKHQSLPQLAQYALTRMLMPLVIVWSKNITGWFFGFLIFSRVSIHLSKRPKWMGTFRSFFNELQ